MSRRVNAGAGRRRFLRGLAAAAAWAAAGAVLPQALGQGRRERPDPPSSVSWQTVLAPAGEPGQPLVVSGTVFAADRARPAGGVLIYAYHTDARGLYTADGRPGEPRLRGWARTDEKGRYEFRTIRPGSYPGRQVPAHVHMAVTSTGQTEQTVDDLWFEDDPLLGESERRRFAGTGRFSPICRTRRDPAGTLHCTRDIRLPGR